MQTSFKDSEFSRYNGLTIGKVYAVYPESNMMDVLLFDGSMLKDVQMMVPYASSSAGVLNMPLPKYETPMLDRDMPLSTAKQDETDVFAVIAFLGGSIIRPIALGFLFPEVNEVLCGVSDNEGNKNAGMYFFKHSSNVHQIIDKDGQIQISHPSGLLIKIGSYNGNIGENVDEQEIVPINWDNEIRPLKTGNPLSEDDEKSEAPWVHVYHPSGTYFTIDNEGNVETYVVGDLTQTVEGNVTEVIEGTVDRTITGDVTETFKSTFTRTVEGDVTETLQGNVTENISGNLNEAVTGSVTVTGATMELEATGQMTITGNPIEEN